MEITNMGTVRYIEMLIDNWPHRRYPDGEWQVLNGHGEWDTLTPYESRKEEAAFQKFRKEHK
jgi:hypothetical protein